MEIILAFSPPDPLKPRSYVRKTCKYKKIVFAPTTKESSLNSSVFENRLNASMSRNSGKRIPF